MIDVKKMTRAKAEKLVAATTNDETLRALAQHVNKHVQAKATFKRAHLEALAHQRAYAASC